MERVFLTLFSSLAEGREGVVADSPSSEKQALPVKMSSSSLFLLLLSPFYQVSLCSSFSVVGWISCVLDPCSRCCFRSRTWKTLPKKLMVMEGE